MFCASLLCLIDIVRFAKLKSFVGLADLRVVRDVILLLGLVFSLVNRNKTWHNFSSFVNGTGTYLLLFEN